MHVQGGALEGLTAVNGEGNCANGNDNCANVECSCASGEGSGDSWMHRLDSVVQNRRLPYLHIQFQFFPDRYIGAQPTPSPVINYPLPPKFIQELFLPALTTVVEHTPTQTVLLELHRTAADAVQRTKAAELRAAKLRHQLQQLDAVIAQGSQQGGVAHQAGSRLAGRCRAVGCDARGRTTWSPAGRVVYDYEDYSLYDNQVGLLTV